MTLKYLIRVNKALIALINQAKCRALVALA